MSSRKVCRQDQQPWGQRFSLYWANTGQKRAILETLTTVPMVTEQLSRTARHWLRERSNTDLFSLNTMSWFSFGLITPWKVGKEDPQHQHMMLSSSGPQLSPNQPQSHNQALHNCWPSTTSLLLLFLFDFLSVCLSQYVFPHPSVIGRFNAEWKTTNSLWTCSAKSLYSTILAGVKLWSQANMQASSH